jgi:hypothetical protein
MMHKVDVAIKLRVPFQPSLEARHADEDDNIAVFSHSAGEIDKSSVLLRHNERASAMSVHTQTSVS